MVKLVPDGQAVRYQTASSCVGRVVAWNLEHGRSIESLVIC